MRRPQARASEPTTHARNTCDSFGGTCPRRSPDAHRFAAEEAVGYTAAERRARARANRDSRSAFQPARWFKHRGGLLHVLAAGGIDILRLCLKIVALCYSWISDQSSWLSCAGLHAHTAFPRTHSTAR